MTIGNKEYIGDGVYVSLDGDGIVLTTEDGIRSTNTIYLESGVLAALLRYIKRQSTEGDLP